VGLVGRDDALRSQVLQHPLVCVIRRADRFDRRRLLLVTQPLAATLSGVLALVTAFDLATAPLVISFGLAQGVVTAFSTPAATRLSSPRSSRVRPPILTSGFGIVSVRRTGEVRRVTALDWPHPVQQPLGPHIDAWFARQRWLAAHRDGEALQGAVLVLAADVVQEQLGAPGAEDPAHLVLRQQVGLRRVVEADTATAALTGACDGRLPVGTLVAAVREVLGEVPDGLLDEVRHLVEVGVLDPPV